MDEYNIANAFIGFDEIKASDRDDLHLDSYQKIPFSVLAGLGGALAEMVPAFRTVTNTFDVDTAGLYRALNPKTKEVMELMFESHQVAGAKIGSMKQASGKFDQAALMKVNELKGSVTSIASVNPATVLIAGAIMAMNVKLDKIMESQQNMMKFLEDDKKTKLEGTLNFLTEVFNNYRYNWDKDLYKQTTHVKANDIKQESEQSIIFYRKQIDSILEKKKLLTNRAEVRKLMGKMIEQFSAYRLALYLYSFAAFLEVLLLDNFKKDYLSEISAKIRDYSYTYAELYTRCYTWLLDNVKKSIETGVMKGVAVAAKGVGQFINKIPVVERGQLDENLIKAGEKLNEYKDDSADELLSKFVAMSNSSITQFSDLIDTISELHNKEQDILFDENNLYMKAVG